MKAPVLAALLATASALMAAPPPNIVMLLADDQGWGDLSVNGNRTIQTPHIDSLACDGVTLDRFFVCAVCAPTRAEMLTGRYHPRGGVRGVSTGQERLNADVPTLADHFKAAGYATGLFGKWHNGSQWPYHPMARGFDEFYGFTSGHWGEYFDPPLEHNGKLVRGKGFIADDLTDHALAFIEKNVSRPFLCYVPFNTPHSPFCVPDAYWNRLKDQPVAQRGLEGEKEDIQVTRCALAMCVNLDDNVGRILRRLEELQLASNTIVIYFSDNGPNSSRWNDGMKGRKGSVDEGGVRSPCFIRWPGHVTAGRKIPTISGAIDLLPTLAALSGVGFISPQPLDGIDLSPLLLGRETKGTERILFSHQNGKVSARTQGFRLDERGGLFDMTTDPGQKRNVAAEQPDITSRLQSAVAAWRRDVLSGTVRDERAFPVGYREFPWTPLPARDGEPHGSIRRSAQAPNCSYFVNWTSTADTITWDIEVATTGEYDIELLYACPPADAGSTVAVEFRDQKVTAEITKGWDAPLIDHQDRVPRKGESYMREFRPMHVGKLLLQKGRGMLTLRALSVKGSQVAEVRQLNLTLRPDGR